MYTATASGLVLPVKSLKHQPDALFLFAIKISYLVRKSIVWDTANNLFSKSSDISFVSREGKSKSRLNNPFLAQKITALSMM